MRRRHQFKNEFTEPDLPITPMLDMSFQLLAFFLTTFNPQPTEGHMDLALPKVEGGASNKIPDPLDQTEIKEEFTIKIDSDDKGDVATVSLAVSKDDAGTLIPGAGREARLNLLKELKVRLASAKADHAKRGGNEPFYVPKIKLDLPDNLSYKIVVMLIDETNRAGYRDVAPAMKDDKK